MEGTFWVIKTDEQKANAAAAVATCPVNPQKPFYVQILEYNEKRSKAQNRLSHQWYIDISTQGKEYTPKQVKAISKYHYGLPIMRADDVYMKYWGLARFDELDYQDVLIILEEWPMTSSMGIKQMTKYLTDLQNETGQQIQTNRPVYVWVGEIMKLKKLKTITNRLEGDIAALLRDYREKTGVDPIEIQVERRHLYCSNFNDQPDKIIPGYGVKVAVQPSSLQEGYICPPCPPPSTRGI